MRRVVPGNGIICSNLNSSRISKYSFEGLAHFQCSLCCMLCENDFTKVTVSFISKIGSVVFV